MEQARELEAFFSLENPQMVSFFFFNQSDVKCLNCFARHLDPLTQASKLIQTV